MNTIWMKIAGVAVVAAVVLIVASKYTGGGADKPEPAAEAEEPKTFYDMAERDKQFAEPPKPVETPTNEPQPEPAATTTEQTVQPAPQPTPQTSTRPAGVVLPSDITKPTTLYFKPLGEIEDIEAQQVFPYATTGRSIGRLPVMQYGLMMKAIDQIEQRWPDSWYNFRAKQMMEEITQYSDRYAQMYKITPQRLDISKFLKPGRETQPMTVEPIRR